ncbi:MAG: nitrous oxide reductase accessory protein NosL [Nitrospirota bacterium]
MKKWLIIVGVVLAMAMPSLALSEEICGICGMDASKIQTKFSVTIEGKKIPICSVRHMYELVFMKHKVGFADRENPILQSIEAMDFKSGKMFKAMDGFFVVGIDVVPKGSMEPYMLGFSTLERANNFWGKNKKPGVRVVPFESATHEVIGVLRIEGKLPQPEAPMEQIEITIQEKGMAPKEEKK